MEITVNKEQRCTVVEIKGRLDTTNYINLENQFTKIIDGGERSVVVDCKQLDYLSSSGLRVFLIALKRLSKEQGKFVLFGLQPNVQEIFEVSGFITIFKVYDNKELALVECEDEI